MSKPKPTPSAATDVSQTTPGAAGVDAVKCFENLLCAVEAVFLVAEAIRAGIRPEDRETINQCRDARIEELDFGSRAALMFFARQSSFPVSEVMACITGLRDKARRLIECGAGTHPQEYARRYEELAEAQQLAQDMLAVDALSATKTEPPRRTAHDPKQEARDEWIYQQCLKGKEMPYRSIITELTRLVASKGWEPIESVQGIRSAARVYAERHGLAEIPRRQDL